MEDTALALTTLTTETGKSDRYTERDINISRLAADKYRWH